MNISFAKLGEERCERCMEQNEHMKDSHPVAASLSNAKAFPNNEAQDAKYHKHAEAQADAESLLDPESLPDTETLLDPEAVPGVEALPDPKALPDLESLPDA